MKISDFKKLHRDLRVSLPNTIEFNPLPSATDPTQDIPIKNIELAANGVPINVSVHNMPMSGVKIENFTTIEKRNNDVFDNVAELQKAASTVSGSGASTDYKPIKTPKKHE